MGTAATLVTTSGLITGKTTLITQRLRLGTESLLPRHTSRAEEEAWIVNIIHFWLNISCTRPPPHVLSQLRTSCCTALVMGSTTTSNRNTWTFERGFGRTEYPANVMFPHENKKITGENRQTVLLFFFFAVHCCCCCCLWSYNFTQIRSVIGLPWKNEICRMSYDRANQMVWFSVANSQVSITSRWICPDCEKAWVWGETNPKKKFMQSW